MGLLPASSKPIGQTLVSSCLDSLGTYWFHLGRHGRLFAKVGQEGFVPCLMARDVPDAYAFLAKTYELS